MIDKSSLVIINLYKLIIILVLTSGNTFKIINHNLPKKFNKFNRFSYRSTSKYTEVIRTGEICLIALDECN